MEITESDAYASINQVIQKKRYRAALDLYVRNKNLIKLCSDQSPKSFSLHRKLEHNGITVLPDPEVRINCEYFEEVILTEIEKFSRLIAEVSFHRQLNIWAETFGRYYPATYSFELYNSNIVLEIHPGNPYETGLYNKFWLDQVLSGRVKVESPILDHIRKMRWVYLYSYQKITDRLSFTEKTIAQLMIEILNADLQDLYQAIENDENDLLYSSVWTSEQLIKHAVIYTALAWLEEMEKSEEDIIKIAGIERAKYIMISGSLAEKITAYAKTYRLLKSEGILSPYGPDGSHRSAFYQHPEKPPNGGEALDAYQLYNQIINEELDYLEEIFNNPVISTKEKLSAQYQVMGTYERKKFFINGEERILGYIPVHPEDIRAYNLEKVRLYEKSVYSSIVAEHHKQRSFEERKADFLIQNPDQRKKFPFLEIKKTWKKIPRSSLMEELVSMMDKRKEIPHLIPWTFSQAAYYIVARDAFRYLDYLSNKEESRSLFRIP